MKKTFGIIACFYGLTAVIIGAFGAHALGEKLDPRQHQIFETGIQYQFYHVAALLVVFFLGTKTNSKTLNMAGWFFTIGIVLFSGSLYLLSTRELLGIEEWTPVLGPVTPIGGLCFITGWIFLLVSIRKL